ncbi:MAG TPA: hypothetical protein VNG69_07085 [Casimicrobiaceae bacterium]|nr:hypothetical protein [Casimicrobiaceae bacterium]
MRRALVVLANLAAFALLACVIAYWGWRWFGPEVFVAPPPPPVDPLRAFALSPPFGVSKSSTVATAPAPVTTNDPRLLGVLAEANGRGHALFRMPDGSARLTVAGGEVSPNLTLASVRADGITLRDASGERVIALRATSGSSNERDAKSRLAACALPAGYKGPIVRLNAELVQGLMAQPDSLRALAQAQDGALVVRDEAGFAAMLGMKKGDRVAQANGIALRSPEDIVVAVLRPLAQSQVVRLSGSRGSEARELVIVNAGACPT